MLLASTGTNSVESLSRLGLQLSFWSWLISFSSRLQRKYVARKLRWLSTWWSFLALLGLSSSAVTGLNLSTVLSLRLVISPLSLVLTWATGFGVRQRVHSRLWGRTEGAWNHVCSLLVCSRKPFRSCYCPLRRLRVLKCRQLNQLLLRRRCQTGKTCWGEGEKRAAVWRACQQRARSVISAPPVPLAQFTMESRLFWIPSGFEDFLFLITKLLLIFI